jgi:hypothetical protein
MLFASRDSFGFDNRRLISSNSAPDLITTPLFFEAKPEESTGLISMAKAAALPLNAGNLSKNTPGKLVAFLSQSLPSFRYWNNLSSVVMIHHKPIGQSTPKRYKKIDDFYHANCCKYERCGL